MVEAPSPALFPFFQDTNMKIAIVKRTGTVSWINESKGFGLIKPDDGGKDLFTNFPARKEGAKPGNLKIKQKVTYDVERAADGDRAVNVKTIV
jgi:CspA family cold shock protein